jgi:hypothetical protein
MLQLFAWITDNWLLVTALLVVGIPVLEWLGKVNHDGW